MTAHPLREGGGPVPLCRGITALLRSLPGPDGDDRARARWLAAKADLFDRIATAAATTALAEDATAAARAARTALAGLTSSTATATSSTTNGSSTGSTTSTTSENATTTCTGGAK